MNTSRHGFVVRQLSAHRRLVISILVGIAVALCCPPGLVQERITRVLLGWNTTIWLYLVLVGVMVLGSTRERMRSRAALQDDGKFLLLVLVVVTAIASLVAIVAELVVVRDMTGFDKGAHIALAACTIVGSWTFTHTMFALHYAHDYYASHGAERDGGLAFPGTEHPDYWDFLYFSLVIGTSGQTADVSFTSQALRRVGAVHCALAFFFNTTVLALTINIAAGLL